jgi:hypothetical protein
LETLKTNSLVIFLFSLLLGYTGMFLPWSEIRVNPHDSHLYLRLQDDKINVVSIIWMIDTIIDDCTNELSIPGSGESFDALRRLMSFGVWVLTLKVVGWIVYLYTRYRKKVRSYLWKILRGFILLCFIGVLTLSLMGPYFYSCTYLGWMYIEDSVLVWPVVWLNLVSIVLGIASIWIELTGGKNAA